MFLSQIFEIFLLRSLGNKKKVWYIQFYFEFGSNPSKKERKLNFVIPNLQNILNTFSIPKAHHDSSNDNQNSARNNTSQYKVLVTIKVWPKIDNEKGISR